MKSLSIILLIIVSCLGCSSNSDEKLIGDLLNTNPEVQKSALLNIVDNELTEALPNITGLANDPSVSKGIRLRSIEALGDLADEKAIPPLANILQDNDQDLAEKAAESLGKIKSPKATPYLTNFLEKEIQFTSETEGNEGNRTVTKSNLRTQLAAIWALGNIGSIEALPVLKKLLSCQDKYIKFNAQQSLKKIADDN